MTRIIGGAAGGRQIAVPGGGRTRPTSDKVREALFSSLDARGVVKGAVVLDLYAGSGALGLEAISRGAASATFVDELAAAGDTIRRNAADLGLGPVTVLRGDALRMLTRQDGRAHDLVLVDPPYDLPETDLTAVLQSLVDHGWLAADAFVVVERSTRSGGPPWPSAMEPAGHKTYGETAVWFAWGPARDEAEVAG